MSCAKKAAIAAAAARIEELEPGGVEQAPLCTSDDEFLILRCTMCMCGSPPKNHTGPTVF